MTKNQILIHLSESENTKFGKEEFARQSFPQKVFSAIWAVGSEVNNGGFSQYFVNSSAETAAFVVEALRTIGAPDTAAICERALAAAFPTGLPDSEDAIRSLASDFPDEIIDKLEELDQKFFSYPHDLTELLFTYVSEHCHSVRDDCRVRQYGIDRWLRAPCVAGGRHHGPSAGETLAGARERHRPLRADALSFFLRFSLASRKLIERTYGGVEPVLEDMEVARGRLQVAMSEQQLNGAQIGSAVGQVRGKGMPHHMGGKPLSNAQLLAQLMAESVDGAGVHRPVGPHSGKEPVLGLALVPVGTEPLQQLGRKPVSRQLTVAA